MRLVCLVCLVYVLGVPSVPSVPGVLGVSGVLCVSCVPSGCVVLGVPAVGSISYRHIRAYVPFIHSFYLPRQVTAMGYKGFGRHVKAFSAPVSPNYVR